MQRFSRFLIFSFFLWIVSCGIFTKIKDKPNNLPNRVPNNTPNTNISYNNKVISSIVNNARTYIGTPYKYGGMTEDGLDCSGLVTLAFQSARLKLPRVSAEMATVGREVKMQDVRTGDLVFFINNSGSIINHVGIVTERKSADNIIFIHSANSGVREDNLFSKYYKSIFAKATRPF